MGADMRDSSIDFVKGCAIILMVFGHAGYCGSVELDRFINLFHMPVFFIAAGYFYRCIDSLEGFKTFVIKKLRRLWWPYFLWTTIYLLLGSWFIEVSILPANTSPSPTPCDLFLGWGLVRTLTLMRGTLFTTAFWFLKALLYAFFITALLDLLFSRLLKSSNVRMVVKTIIAVGVLAYLRWGTMLNISIREIMLAFGLVQIGVLIRIGGNGPYNFVRSYPLFSCLICGLVLVLMSSWGEVCCYAAAYPCVLFLILTSCAGWFFIISIYQLTKCWGPAAEAICYVGRHTMPIIIFHYISFKLVTFVGCCFILKSYDRFSLFPTSFTGSVWCLSYTLVGVIVPMLIAYVYNTARKKLVAICPYLLPQ